MKVIDRYSLLVLLALLCHSSLVSAQAVTVLSSGQDARTCSFAAEASAMSMVASAEDVDSCTRAIEYGGLKISDLASTLVNRGIILAAQERYQEALNDYNRAMAMMPELPEPYVGRGNLLFLADSFDLAVADYNKALELNLGRKHIAIFNRGMAYEKLGKTSEAKADYSEALRLMPDWLPPKEKLDQLTARQQ
jgi:tetratricopeptide (TPR) repeat protein